MFAPIWFHLPLFDPKIPFVSIFRIAYLHLPLFTYIWPSIDVITPIWSYLPLIALILPYVPYSMYSSIETLSMDIPVNMPISGQHRISSGLYWQYRTSGAGTGPVLAHHMLPIHYA